MKRSGLAVLAAALMLAGAAVGRIGPNDAAQASPRGQTLDEVGNTTRRGDGAQMLAQIGQDPVAPTIAPRGADVTLVIFSDYQCPYCRKVHPVIQALMREDRRVRIVYRDWPVFGPASIEAARVAIAANYQGRHAAFNNALMATRGRIGSPQIRAAADRAGVDWARLQRDLATHRRDIDGAISRTGRYAQAIGLTGTPGMLVGNILIPGAVDLAQLRRAVATARQSR